MSIALEEFGLEYRVHPVNILQNEQFDPDFLKFNFGLPNTYERFGSYGAVGTPIKGEPSPRTAVPGVVGKPSVFSMENSTNSSLGLRQGRLGMSVKPLSGGGGDNLLTAHSLCSLRCAAPPLRCGEA